MRYQKPELVAVSSAAGAIRSGLVKMSTFLDNRDPSHPINATATAYEADE
jgi:hypothetical protein